MGGKLLVNGYWERGIGWVPGGTWIGAKNEIYRAA